MPSGKEWVTLTDYLGGDTVAGVKLIAAGNWLEEPPEPSNINESGFTALPAGTLFWRSYQSHQWAVFENFNFLALWLTSEKTEESVFVLGFDGWFLMKSNMITNNGLSVRCIRD